MNFQKYAYFVVNMCVPGRPAKHHLYLRENRRRGSSRVTTADNCCLRGILMFWLENAIFVDDSRYPGAPGRGGPVGRVARVPPERSFGVRVLKLSDTAVRHPLAPSGASTEVPRRISLGFAHSAAAGGDWRKERSYAACSCWKTVCISCAFRFVHAEPAELL